LGGAVTGSAATRRVMASEPRLFFAVAALVFLTRLPFVDAGYGAIRDAWRVASAARLIATTHEYWASRFPPHPVQEIVSAAIWWSGPLGLNLATAVISSLGIAFFALSARRLGYGDWALASAALALTPQIYINSTSTIDYLWALSFVFASIYFALRHHPLPAGLLLGLAIGARITSGAMLLPLAFLIVRHGEREGRLRRLATFWLAACAVGVLLFIPAFQQYGWDTLTFAEIAERRPYEVLRRASLEVWGAVGTLAICGAVAYEIIRAVRSPSRWTLRRPSFYAYVWLIPVVIYTIAFLRLPHLAAYLIPVIPFVLLILHELLHRRAFVFLCVVLSISSFIGIGLSGPVRGAIFDDREKRIVLMKMAQRFVAIGNALPGRNVVVAGHWLSPVYVYVLEHPDDSTRYVYLLTADEAERYRRRGAHLYYLPGQRELNLERNRIDLRTFGARALPED
jgi:hypothetical protein